MISAILHEYLFRFRKIRLDLNKCLIFVTRYYTILYQFELNVHCHRKKPDFYLPYFHFRSLQLSRMNYQDITWICTLKLIKLGPVHDVIFKELVLIVNLIGFTHQFLQAFRFFLAVKHSWPIFIVKRYFLQIELIIFEK